MDRNNNYDRFERITDEQLEDFLFDVDIPSGSEFECSDEENDENYDTALIRRASKFLHEIGEGKLEKDQSQIPTYGKDSTVNSEEIEKETNLQEERQEETPHDNPDVSHVGDLPPLHPLQDEQPPPDAQIFEMSAHDIENIEDNTEKPNLQEQRQEEHGNLGLGDLLTLHTPLDEPFPMMPVIDKDNTEDNLHQPNEQISMMPANDMYGQYN